METEDETEDFGPNSTSTPRLGRKVLNTSQEIFPHSYRKTEISEKKNSLNFYLEN